jgi:GT2 family glycosyltransferase
MTPTLPVAVVIPVWNGLEDTLECLASLARITYDHVSVVIVDNGSTDGSADALGSRPDTVVIRNETNRGFTRGCNEGMRQALAGPADYILLLNNDTVVTPDFLSLLVDALERDETAGMAGPKVYQYGAERIFDSAGVRALPWLAQPFLRGHGETDRGQYDQQEESAYVTGCALLIKRAVIERIGLLDEDYTNYFEDFDWGYRARLHGFRLLYVPDALIYHKGSRTSGLWSPFYYHHNTRSRILFARKHVPWLPFLIAFLPYLALYRYLLPAARLLAHRRWEHLRALHRGIKEGFTAPLTSKSR